MRIFGWYVFSGKALENRDRKMSEQSRSAGFRDAVSSLIKALESKDQIVLGNCMSFVGAKIPGGLTLIGGGVTIMNSNIGSSKKYQDSHEPIVKISNKL